MRRLLGTLAGAACALLLSTAAFAATFTVTKTADTADGACGADCSLREAVVAANADAVSDTILIPAGTYTLSIAGTGEDAAATGDLDVTQPVTILGAGRDATVVDADGIDRVFQIFVANERVEFRSLRIRGGNPPGAFAGGGGVAASFFANVAMTNVAFSDNTAGQGGGFFANQRSNPSFKGSVIEDNAATATGVGGGGIWCNCDSLSIVASVLRDNSAAGDGGGVNVQAGPVTIRDTTFEGNSAGYGGGAMVAAAHPVNVTGSLFFDNRAQIYGGAVVQYGGGPTTFYATNTTFASNSVLTGGGDNNGELGGGAIALNRFAASQVVLTHVTLVNNSTLPHPTVPTATGSALTCSDCMGNFTLRNTIVSGPGGSPLCQGKFVGQTDTEPVSLGGNVDVGTTCGFSQPTDQSGVGDADLAPLNDNGGLTFTRAIASDSPARDAGVAADPPVASDQRGFGRDAMPDSGAYEFFQAGVSAFVCPGDYAGVASLADYSVTDLVPQTIGDAAACLGGLLD